MTNPIHPGEPGNLSDEQLLRQAATAARAMAETEAEAGASDAVVLAGIERLFDLAATDAPAPDLRGAVVLLARDFLPFADEEFVPQVGGTLLISPDGMPIAGDRPDGFELDPDLGFTAALSAAQAAVARRVTFTLGESDLAGIVAREHHDDLMTGEVIRDRPDGAVDVRVIGWSIEPTVPAGKWAEVPPSGPVTFDLSDE